RTERFREVRRSNAVEGVTHECYGTNGEVDRPAGCRDRVTGRQSRDAGGSVDVHHIAVLVTKLRLQHRETLEALQHTARKSLQRNDAGLEDDDGAAARAAETVSDRFYKRGELFKTPVGESRKPSECRSRDVARAGIKDDGFQ